MRWLFLAVILPGLAWPALALAQGIALQQRPRRWRLSSRSRTSSRRRRGTPDIANVPTTEDPRRLDPVVVTATMVATPLEQLGATVTVVTGDEITQYNYDRIEDVFRQVPGVQVQTTGTPGKATSLSIRGGGSQRAIVLVDGLRTASPTLGATDLSEITIDSIERIEILRGPQSTLYGADAITGVVNIITKKGQGPATASVWLEGGNYTTFREQVNVQGALGDFNFNVTGSQFNTNGNLPNDDTAQTSSRGGSATTFPGAASCRSRVATRISTSSCPSSRRLPPSSTPMRPTTTGLYNLVYKQSIFEWWDVKASVGQWFNNAGFQNRPPPGTDITLSQIDTQRLQADLISTFTIPKWNTLTLGWEYRSESGTDVTQGTFPTDFSATLNTLAFFGQDELTLFDRLFLGGGLRWEENSQFGTNLTGRASAALLVKETGSKLRFAWGQGFRAPTINDLFFPGFSNPNLQPEESTSWEIGFDQRLWKDRIRFGATYFNNQFRNLIQFVFDPTTFLFAPQNVGRARIQGMESYANFDPFDWLGFYVTYMYLDATNLDTGGELARVPRNTINTGVTVTPFSRLTLFMQANVLSSQLESSFAGRNPGYFRIDTGGTLLLAGRHGMLNRLEATLRIQNLTNQSYDEVLGFPAPGINALVGLRAYLQ